MAYGGIQVPRTLLCVNVSHVAALRSAKGESKPDPAETARICTQVGCNSIAVRLRTDRRHVQDRDVLAIRKVIPENGKVYLEIALSGDMIDFARRVRPSRVTIVPEKKEDMTENGGLDVRKNMDEIRSAGEIFNNEGMPVSLFIDPDIEMIRLARECGAKFIEVHTGTYSRAAKKADIGREIGRIHKALEYAAKVRIRVNAGCGLNYDNVKPLLDARELLELNIGRAIISRSDSVGLATAVEEMMAILD